MFGFEVVGMLICFSCVVAMAFGGQGQESETSDQSNNLTFIIGISLSLFGALSASTSAILTRKLKDADSTILLTVHGLLGFVVTSVVIALIPLFSGESQGYFAGINLLSYSSQSYYYLFLALCFDVLGLNAMIIAYQSGSSGFVSLISYAAIVYSFALDLIVFDENFSLRQLLCSLITLSTIIVVSVLKI